MFNVIRNDFSEALVYDRYRLTPGMKLSGPAIVEERESTVVIPEMAHVTVDPHGNLVIDLLTQPSLAES